MGTWDLDERGVPVPSSRKNGGVPYADGISVNCAGKIFTPMTNSCFGGTDNKTMLIVSGQGAGALRVETAQMTVPGIP